MHLIQNFTIISKMSKCVIAYMLSKINWLKCILFSRDLGLVFMTCVETYSRYSQSAIFMNFEIDYFSLLGER